MQLVLTWYKQMKATFDGLQVILVGDLQELPLLKLSAPKFMATATDWSSDLVAKTILSPSVDFFNLSNSQWEPLVDPWEIHLSVRFASCVAGEACSTLPQMSKQAEKGKSSYKFESKKRLEVNLSSTFIDIANTTMSQLSHEADSVINMDRGARAPFLIKNRTGHHIQIQAGTSSRSSALKEPTRIDNGRDLPWRFDDWRTMREVRVISDSSYVVSHEYAVGQVF